MTTAKRDGSHRWLGLSAWLALVLLAAPTRSQGLAPPQASEDDTAHVLVITAMDPYLPAFVTIDRAMRTAMTRNHHRSVQFLYESIDAVRLGAAPGTELADVLAAEYQRTRIDAVVLIAEPAADFYLRFRDRLWPNVPVIAHSLSQRSADRLPRSPGLTLLPASTDFAETLRIARRLQPRAKRVVVVGGTAPYDEMQLDPARSALQADRIGLPVKYLVGPSLDEIAGELAYEPPDTIALFVSLFRDESGKVYVPREVIEQLSALSAVPIYGAFDSYLGYGITGGSIESFTERGERVADLIVAALDRPTAAAVTADLLPSRCIVDARQLKRYNLSERALPEGCEVRFVEPSFFALYWWQTLLVCAALVAQTVLIAGLLVQHRRRRVAEHRLQAQRSQLLHAARLAVAGELTAAIAHEINQPLGAILSNADAAEMMMKDGRLDRDELQQILGDIRRDDLRASEVIKRLRAFLARQEVERRPCNMNQIAQHASAFLGAEARRRGHTVEYELECAEPHRARRLGPAATGDPRARS